MSKISELKRSVDITLKAAAEQKEGFVEDLAMMLRDVAEILEELEGRIEQLERARRSSWGLK